MELICNHLLYLKLNLIRLKHHCEENNLNLEESLNHRLFDNFITLKMQIKITIEKPLTLFKNSEFYIDDLGAKIDLDKIDYLYLINKIDNIISFLYKKDVIIYFEKMCKDKTIYPFVFNMLNTTKDEHITEYKDFYSFFVHNTIPEFFFHKSLVYISIKFLGVELGKTNFMKG